MFHRDKINRTLDLDPSISTDVDGDAFGDVFCGEFSEYRTRGQIASEGRRDITRDEEPERRLEDRNYLE